LTHLIGKPLVQLEFARERYEADFRFALARLREYGEQVALLRGENAEKGYWAVGLARSWRISTPSSAAP